MSDNERIQELLDKAILSLNEWKELVTNRCNLIRSAPQYIKDAMDYYGVKHDNNFGRRTSYMEALQLSPKPEERLIGHGGVQARIYNILTTLCRDNTKMILLVGPNGSAKSTFWNAVSYALEAYSKTSEGARYQIEWVFPHGDDGGKRVGFSRISDPLDADTSFAFMDDEKLDKVPCDASCTPAWLYEHSSRKKYFPDNNSKYLLNHELCPKCYHILQELINVYKTKKKVMTEYDPDEVLKLAERHIRIRKAPISKIYQEGVAVVDPGNTPLTAPRPKYPYGLSKKRTPFLLKNIELPDLNGPLAQSSNGMLIMEDSLEGILQFVSQFLNDKRKMNIDNERFTLDIMLVGSVNPEKFDQLKSNPEYNRFRTRLEIINVPYLLNYEDETRIYKHKFDDLREYYHIAPHTEQLFSLFCVMSRLEPMMDNRDYKGYEESAELSKLKDKIKKLSLLDKAKIYSQGKLPEYLVNKQQFTLEEQNVVNRDIQLIFNEYSEVEGREFGFSYREVDAIADRALMDSPHQFLSPISLMKKLKDVIQHEREDYPFLKDSKKDYEKLLELLDQEYFRIINTDMRDVFKYDYADQIVKEIQKYLVDGLKVIYQEQTKIKNQAGDDITSLFLNERETVIFGKPQSDEEREKFWYHSSARWQPDLDAQKNIKNIFESQIYQARDRLYQERKPDIEKKLEYMLEHLNGGKLSQLTPQEQEDIQVNVQTLLDKGYNEDSSRELVGYLRSNLDRLVLKS